MWQVDHLWRKHLKRAHRVVNPITTPEIWKPKFLNETLLASSRIKLMCAIEYDNFCKVLMRAIISFLWRFWMTDEFSDSKIFRAVPMPRTCNLAWILQVSQLTQSIISLMFLNLFLNSCFIMSFSEPWNMLDSSKKGEQLFSKLEDTTDFMRGFTCWSSSMFPVSKL